MNIFNIFKLNSILIVALGLVAVVLGLTVVGCGSSKQQAMLDTIGSPQARPATFDALGEDFDRAESENVHLIAPQKFASAKKYFTQAEEMNSQNASNEKIRATLDKARADLDSAVTFATQNRDRMSPLIDARNTALNSGATETHNDHLQALEKEYLVLVNQLDSRSSRTRALNRITDLTEEYEKITVKALEAKHLGEASNNLRVARGEGAEKLVPKTLQDTEDLMKKTREYIALNPNADSEQRITALGKETLMASRRLLDLTRQTASSKGLSPEERSLKTEALVHSADESSARLRDRLTGTQERVSELEGKTEDYARLEQKDEQNKAFESVRALFNDNEATVSRQGNSLVLSLKQINFAVNESEIPSPSFGLLEKVKTAISSFEEPTVVIEGHTDSTGSESLNLALSEKRAEAVKRFFVSNNVMSLERVTAKGVGSERPLASNKSSEGRAMNRRIDVIIKN